MQLHAGRAYKPYILLFLHGSFYLGNFNLLVPIAPKVNHNFFHSTLFYCLGYDTTFNLTGNTELLDSRSLRQLQRPFVYKSNMGQSTIYQEGRARGVNVPMKFDPDAIANIVGVAPFVVY